MPETVKPKPINADQLFAVRMWAGEFGDNKPLPRADFLALLADREHLAAENERLAELVAKLEAHLKGATSRAKARRAKLKDAQAHRDATANILRGLARAVIDGDGRAKTLAADVLAVDERGGL